MYITLSEMPFNIFNPKFTHFNEWWIGFDWIFPGLSWVQRFTNFLNLVSIKSIYVILNISKKEMDGLLAVSFSVF